MLGKQEDAMRVLHAKAIGIVGSGEINH
jgi:hypothetical protein